MSTSQNKPDAPPAVQHVLASRDPTQSLMSELRAMAIDQPRLVKCTAHPVPPARPGQHISPSDPKTITSWKMLEHLYRTSPCPFPTLARGLFTAWSSKEGAAEPAVKGAAKGRSVQERRKEEEKGEWRIVARGYDKFFNVGEVGWTEWSALAQNTSAPYELTLKSNGCLILIAALSPSRLLVTSKHSLGTRNSPTDNDPTDPDEGPAPQPDGPLQTSHAERGEQWLLNHLKAAQKSEEDLAKVLWERNMSAVAELCDDTFEEHVLPIPADLTGLVLHGLIPNSPSFESLPGAEVAAFAREWGMKETQIVSVGSIKEVREFCREGARKGEWEGIGVEGWVVRCRVRDPTASPAEESEQKQVDDLADEIENLVISDPGDEPVHGHSKEDKKGRRTRTPPYPPGAPFFFKVKFEEPYLMYREWRELTKILLPVLEGRAVQWELEAGKKAGKGNKDSAIKVPARFKNRPETRVYTSWVLRQMKLTPELFKNYKYNRGIIEVRDKFLEWTAQGEGKEEWERIVGKGAKGAGVVKDLEKIVWEAGKVARAQKRVGEVRPPSPQQTRNKHRKFAKTLIVPVAIPGCGKTSVAVALGHVFNMGHTQSDDVKSKATSHGFVKNVSGLLTDHELVFADRNNHLTQHRTQLREAAWSAPGGPVRVLALNWGLTSVPVSTVHRLMSARLLARGENHQSLRAQKDNIDFHEEVLWNFIQGADPLDEDEVDEVVEMDVREGMEDNIRRAVREVARVLGREVPPESKIQEAIEAARAHKAGQRTKEDAKPGAADKGKGKVQYYALLAEIDLPQVLQPVLGSDSGPMGEFWKKLVADGRVSGRPHVTLAHQADHPRSEEGKRFWQECAEVAARAEPPLYEFALSHVVCDGRIMACVVDPASIGVREVEGSGEGKVDWGGERMGRLHVTVGTSDPSVRNVEAGKVVREWREGRTSGVWSKELGGVKVVGRLKGLQR